LEFGTLELTNIYSWVKEMDTRTSKVSNGAHAPLLVAIVGGSGAGKTWLAKKLRAALEPDAAHFSLDDFYRDCSRIRPERRAKINFDHPRTIDWECMEKVLDDLRTGRARPVAGRALCP
jgi:uridine kinase